jgi:hypothetical protein
MKVLVSKCKNALQSLDNVQCDLVCNKLDRETLAQGLQLTTTPPSKMHPTIVVPVLVAFGSGTPLACKAALRVWFEKSNPGIVANEAPWSSTYV